MDTISTVEIYLQELSEKLDSHAIGQADWETIPRPEQWRRIISSIGNYGLSEWQDCGGLWVMDTTANPGANHTDMPNALTLKKLEEDGVITPKSTKIVDISSGSVGRSQAWLCKQMGYELITFIPECLPANRIAPIAALGANVVTQGHDIPDTVKALKRYIASLNQRETIQGDDYIVVLGNDKDGQPTCWLNHPGNQLTINAQRHLGVQLAEKAREIGNISFTHIVSVIGNGTSTQGLIVGYKASNDSNNVEFIGVEPTEGAVHYAKLYPKYTPSYESAHPMWGSSRNKTPLSIDPTQNIDDIRLVKSQDALDYAFAYNHTISPEKTIGNTTALAILAAMQIRQEDTSSQVATLWYDNGYLN